MREQIYWRGRKKEKGCLYSGTIQPQGRRKEGGSVTTENIEKEEEEEEENQDHDFALCFDGFPYFNNILNIMSS